MTRKRKEPAPIRVRRVAYDRWEFNTDFMRDVDVFREFKERGMKWEAERKVWVWQDEYLPARLEAHLTGPGGVDLLDLQKMKDQRSFVPDPVPAPAPKRNPFQDQPSNEPWRYGGPYNNSSDDAKPPTPFSEGVDGPTLRTGARMLYTPDVMNGTVMDEATERRPIDKYLGRWSATMFSPSYFLIESGGWRGWVAKVATLGLGVRKEQNLVPDSLPWPLGRIEQGGSTTVDTPNVDAQEEEPFAGPFSDEPEPLHSARVAYMKAAMSGDDDLLRAAAEALRFESAVVLLATVFE